MTTITELEKKVNDLEQELVMLRSRIADEEGVHVLSDEERGEVQRGITDRLATDEEVATVLSRYGLHNTV